MPPGTRTISDGQIMRLVKEMGAIIRFRRHRVGMRQGELATALGISPNYLSQIESGNRIPAFPLIVRIAARLNMSVDQFLHDAVKLTKEKDTRTMVERANAIGQTIDSMLNTVEAITSDPRR